MASAATEWQCEIDVENGISYVRMSGTVTAGDMLEAQHELAAHHRFDPSYALVLDLRRARHLPLTWGQARAIALRSPIAPFVPRAIVANTIVSASIACAYRDLRADITGEHVVRVCRTLGEAHRWLRARRCHWSPPRSSAERYVCH
jgi:hypothetical protein